jgi:putative phosphoribosyl transferase
VPALSRLADYLAGPENPGRSWSSPTAAAAAGTAPRNRRVADILNDASLGTLLFDLLTPEEERDRANVADIGLLAGRLAGVTGWLRAQPRGARRHRLLRRQHRRRGGAVGRRPSPAPASRPWCPATAAPIWSAPGSRR